jgi:xylulokinase
MNDSHASAFATGAFDDGRLGLMIGTTAVLLDSVDHHSIDLDHEIVSMPAPLAGQYLVWAENGVAGRSVDHAIGALLGGSFDDLPAAFADSPVGADGALFLPWLAGSMAPAANRAMRGGFLNVSFDTTRADLMRAAVEGTARNLRWVLPFVEAFSGHPTEEIVFGGGAARSPEWAQTIADVLSHPVAVLDQPGLAAAAAAGIVALRRHSGDDPLTARLPLASQYEPDPSTATIHTELQGAFEAAFEANRAICEALNPVL